MARILLVEDDELVRLSLALYLRHADHEIIEAMDGLSALEIMSGKTFDIVVTDIIMPGMDGVSLLKILHEKHPKLPVIAISGGGRIDQDNFSAQSLGAQAYLGKPFDPEELLWHVDELITS